MDNHGKNKFAITLGTELNTLTGIELSLYHILLQVADEEGVLTRKQLKKWVNGQEIIMAWEKQLRIVGKEELCKFGMMAANHDGRDRFTQKGYEQIVKLYGSMKYLIEVEDHDKKDGVEREWWGNYFVYTTLLGMTKEAKVLCTNYSGEFNANFMHMYQMMLLIPHINSSLYQHQSHNGSSSDFGGGGGGGGGFTGGGGGGSR